MRPSFIGNYSDFIDDDNSHYPGDTELMSIGSAVGKHLGLQKIGIHIETLLPGRRTSYPHAESEEEEFAFVIDGNPHVWIDGEMHSLRPGDFVAFPSGTGISHTFINNSKSPSRLLVGGEKSKKTNKIIYPLNDARNLVLKTDERYWDEAPKKVLGPHDGLPDLVREGKVVKWNLPTLKTNRLILRAIEMSDVPAVFQYAKNPNVARLVMWEPHKTIADTEAFVKFVHGNYLKGISEYAICLKEHPETMIGSVAGFWSNEVHKIMELGAVLSEEYWGQGIVQEALLRLVDHLWKNFDVVRIQGRAKKENIQSRRMMEKMGMEFEGILKKSLSCKGQVWDMAVYSFTK